MKNIFASDEELLKDFSMSGKEFYKLKEKSINEYAHKCVKKEIEGIKKLHIGDSIEITLKLVLD
ncbi:hypothetical protein M0R04_13210 [Candidatus Dojkabacteria bacterium]|jgi:hypothetical protein|nr:hypothetical protein [Candidatus Dojkabacteria bacterium]